MFASLSSLFPSGLQQVSQGIRSVPEPPEPPPSSSPSPPVVDPPRRRDKKDKHPNEAFIIVRPPPSKSAQPLSLQVQLIPPQARHDKPVQALDSSPDDLDTDLKRTHSIRSETSTQSGYASAGSVSSFASTSTSSSGRRTIIPLYNLNVHSVMPTTILDAGTDAKVAKFAKRGLEVIGLAFFEPIEVRPSSTANGSPPAPTNARLSLDDSHPELGPALGLSLPRPTLSSRPNTSHAPITPLRNLAHKPSVNLSIAPPLSPPDSPPQRPNKRLFARIFRRKDTPIPPPIAVQLVDEDDSAQSCPIPNGIPSVEHPLSLPTTPNYHDSWSFVPFISNTASQTAVLGVHSTLYPPVTNPKGRPNKYVWVVRKWLKGTDTSILNGVMGKLSAGSHDASIPNMSHVEVRFEWAREQKKTSSRKSDRTSNGRESRPVRRRTPSKPKQTLSPDALNPRISFISHISSGSDTGTSQTSHPHAEESDEDSDPEDSETPWTCTLAVQRLGQLSQHYDNHREPDVRLKVGTLAPTPHHPKVVGLLKVPFPLPDIEVESLTVRRRLVTAQGISKTTPSDAAEFYLTAEEIKDTVSSTALWLVVREAFGGVGREGKKGKS